SWAETPVKKPTRPPETKTAENAREKPKPNWPSPRGMGPPLPRFPVSRPGTSYDVRRISLLRCLMTLFRADALFWVSASVHATLVRGNSVPPERGSTSHCWQDLQN